MKTESKWKGEELISTLSTYVLLGGLIISFITMTLETSRIVTFPLTPITMIITFVVLGVLVMGGFIYGLKKANENAGTIVLKGMILQGKDLGEDLVLEVSAVIKEKKLPKMALQDTLNFIESQARALKKLEEKRYSHMVIPNKLLLLEEVKEIDESEEVKKINENKEQDSE